MAVSCASERVRWSSRRGSAYKYKHQSSGVAWKRRRVHPSDSCWSSSWSPVARVTSSIFKIQFLALILLAGVAMEVSQLFYSTLDIFPQTRTQPIPRALAHPSPSVPDSYPADATCPYLTFSVLGALLQGSGTCLSNMDLPKKRRPPVGANSGSAPAVAPMA